MIIYKVTKEKMQPFSKDEVILLLEKSNYYKNGTVNEIIDKGETRILQTPTALYNFINNNR